MFHKYKFSYVIIIISDIVDPNRDGQVSLQEYMAFMISKETENVQSSEEIENAFRAITASDRPYVTKEELYAVSYKKIKLIIVNSIIEFYILFFVFTEPHERNGGLLRGTYEPICRTENRETNRWCFGLH